jgi:hypothetical protein
MDLSVISFLTSANVASQVMKILFDSLSRDTQDDVAKEEEDGDAIFCSSFCAYTATTGDDPVAVAVNKIIIKDDAPTEARHRMKIGNNNRLFTCLWLFFLLNIVFW